MHITLRSTGEGLLPSVLISGRVNIDAFNKWFYSLKDIPIGLWEVDVSFNEKGVAHHTWKKATRFDDLDDLKVLAESYYGIDSTVRKRNPNYVMTRHWYASLAMTLTGKNSYDISDKIDRNHATIFNSRKRISNLLSTNDFEATQMCRYFESKLDMELRDKLINNK